MLQTAAAIHDPVRMRQAGADLLSLALIDARNHSLRWLAAFEPQLGDLAPSADVDPPLWLVGHAAWFQEYWVSRNVQRQRGEAADAARPRLASIDARADDWFDPAAMTGCSAGACSCPTPRPCGSTWPRRSTPRSNCWPSPTTAMRACMPTGSRCCMKTALAKHWPCARRPCS